MFFLYREHPKAKPIVVLEKPWIEYATPDVHVKGIALIHYTNPMGDMDNTKMRRNTSKEAGL